MYFATILYKSLQKILVFITNYIKSLQKFIYPKNKKIGNIPISSLPHERAAKNAHAHSVHYFHF